MKIHFNLCTLVVICITATVASKNGSSHRQKRAYLIYPMGGQFKIVVSVAVPIKLGLKQSMAFGLNLQFQYGVVTNVSQVTEYPPTISKRRWKRQHRFNSERSLAYLGIELMMEKYGINGRTCLLRSICQNAEESFHHTANGIYGHLLHIFFTPDYGDNTVDTDLDPTYLEAQKAGKYGVDCNLLYQDCPYGHGIMDVISFLDNY